MPDLTPEQFERALRTHGFTPAPGLLGYYRLPIPDRHISVSVLNAPRPTRRAQLAYLLAQLRRHIEEEAPHA